MDLDGQELSAVWDTAVGKLSAEAPSAAQLTWVNASRPMAMTDGVFVISAPDDFARDQLRRRFHDPIVQALEGVLGSKITLVITVVPEPDDGSRATVTEPAQPAEVAAIRGEADDDDTDDGRYDNVVALNAGDDGPPTTSNLSDKFVFERFVIGPSNRFAHAAATAVAEAPAKAYNPLFIYGGSGLGKTHLIQAIGHYASGMYPRSKITYVTSEQFTSQFIEEVASQRGSPKQAQQRVNFQRRYRDVDILLIDDIQFLEGAERTQEEFFHTFNALHQAEKQIVLTSDRPPRELANLEQRLRTRFEMGLLVDVQPPDIETRQAILRRKAELEGVHVPPEVHELIASRISTNIRELEGALIRVIAAASLSKQPVTVSLAESALKDLYPAETGHEITAQVILEETSGYFGFAVEELCGPRRTRALVTARQVGMYLTRELTDLSLPQIGNAYGGRDHSTVIHANRKIQNLIKERPTLFTQIQELTGLIKARVRG